MTSPTNPQTDEIERVANAIWAETHYAYEKPTLGEFGPLEDQHTDDKERAYRQAQAAIAALTNTPVGGE